MQVVRTQIEIGEEAGIACSVQRLSLPVHPCQLCKSISPCAYTRAHRSRTLKRDHAERSHDSNLLGKNKADRLSVDGCLVERLRHEQPAAHKKQMFLRVDGIGVERSERRGVSGRQRPHSKLVRARALREVEEVVVVGKERGPPMRGLSFSQA